MHDRYFSVYCFVDGCWSICPFSSGHFLICPFSIYCSDSFFWYLQIFLVNGKIHIKLSEKNTLLIMSWTCHPLNINLIHSCIRPRVYVQSKPVSCYRLDSCFISSIMCMVNIKRRRSPNNLRYLIKRRVELNIGRTWVGMLMWIF